MEPLAEPVFAETHAAEPSPRLARVQPGPLPEGDLRPVTVLFADVKGFTRLAEMLPAERLVRAINHSFDALAEVVVRYGGEIDKFIGDAIMARFGAPVAHEDDPRRAVLAAIEMHTVLRRLNQSLRREIGSELELRIGINTGVVLAGPIGSRHQRTYTVMGDAVNVASRLEHAAPVGGVVVGEATRAHLGDAFRLRQRRAIRVRGRESPVRSFVVLGSSIRGAHRRGTAPCIGRASELRELQAALRSLRDRREVVVHVTGGLGVGKSRLVHALRRTSEGRRYAWLTVACPPYGEDLPYATLAALLRGLIGQLERQTGLPLDQLLARETGTDGLDVGLAVAVVRDLLVGSGDGSGRLSETLPAQYRKGMLARATKSLLRAGSASRGQVVALDDAQWIDHASAAILQEAVVDLGDCALGWLLVQRTEDGRGEPAVQPAGARSFCLDVQALAPQVSQQLASSLLGEAASPEQVKFVVERAEGNPLFLVELCSALADTGEVPDLSTAEASQAGAQPKHLTDHLRSLILGRVDALDERAKRLLQVAAVLGHVFPAALLRGVLRSEADLSVLARLESLGFLVRQAQARGDGAGALWAWRFRHPLMQEAIYASLLASTRGTLHRQAGVALEHLADADVADRLALLALHFGRSDDRERAVAYLHAAGDRARSLYLNREAIRYYDDALSRLGITGADRPLRAGVLAAKGAALEVLAEDEPALDCLLTALQLEERAEVKADLWRQVADVYRRRGAYAPARDALDQAGLALGAAPAATHRARVYIARAMLEAEQGAHAEVRKWAAEALAALESADAIDARRELAAAHRAAGIGCALAGDPTAARSAFEEALTVAQAAGDSLASATIALNLANVVRFLGFVAQARALYQQSLDFYERIGAKRGIAMACNNIADLAWQNGDWETARQSWRRALQLDEEIGDRRGMAIVLANLGGALVRQGAHAEARKLLVRGRTIATEIGDAEALQDVERHLAELAPDGEAHENPTRAA